MQHSTAASMMPTARRPIPLRKRDDLEVTRIEFADGPGFVVHNPVALTYFTLEPAQFCLLNALDGKHTLEDLQTALAESFPSQYFGLPAVQGLVGDLHKQSLVVSSRYGQGPILAQRSRSEFWRKFWQAVRNPLTLRLPGWNPDRTLKWMLPWMRWAYHPLFVTFSLTCVAFAALLLALNFRVFQKKLPEFQQFFGWPNLLWLWMTLAMTKVLHEFGHGLTCRYFGSACREMGVMVLVGSPTLYCDVSDSWRLPNKWQRIAIGAAGMWVESFLSTIALAIWWFSSPGLLNYLCLNVFFVTTISTVIFNANPLMRYDGYYMLADYLAIPNLRAKADRLVQESFARWCLGIDLPHDPLAPRRGRPWFMLYTIASSLYGWFITGSILMFLYSWLKPHQLQSLGIALAVFSLGGMLWGIGANIVRTWKTPTAHPRKPYRWLISLVLLIVFVGGVLMIPIPWFIQAAVVIEPTGVRNVHSLMPGVLEHQLVKPGELVTSGQPLVELSSTELADKQLEVQRKLAEQQSLVRSLEALQDQAELANVREQIVSLEEQLRLLDEETRRLTVRAPVDGRVLAGSPQAPLTLEQRRRRLPTWSSSVLVPMNVGTYLEAGSQVASIAPHDTWQAVLYVSQSDRDDVRVNQKVWLKFDHLPGKTLTATIKEISAEQAEFVPMSISNKLGGPLATATDRDNQERLIDVAYRAIVELDDDPLEYKMGLRGSARVVVSERTLGVWLARQLFRTLHFKL